MKKIKIQLQTIARSLATLSQRVEKITKQADRLQPAKTTSAKKKTPAKKTVAKKKASAPKIAVLGSVLGIISRNKKGVTIASLRARTGLDAKQLSNALYKLSKKGKITPKTRGLYISK